MTGSTQLTPDLKHATLKVALMVQFPVVFAHYGGDGHASLNCGVKRAFLEGKQVMMLSHRTCTFGEQPQRGRVILHEIASGLERMHGRGVVSPVDEDGARCRKISSQQWSPRKLLLCHDGRMLRENPG